MPTRVTDPPRAIWLALARVSELQPSSRDFTPLQSSPPVLAHLSASEHGRLQTITAPRRRAQFIAGRLLLRHLLQHLLPPARTFSVSASDQGPPRLEDGDHGVPPLHLALSHSGDWVCAAATPVPVGLDLETTEGRSRSRDWRALAGLAGSPTEQVALVDLATPSEQGRFFLRLWTLKEAWFKQQARSLDMSMLPHLHTAPATGGMLANACVWQTEDCTLALTRPTADSHDAKLPVHWLSVRPPGPGVDADTDPEALSPLPALARQAPQAWQVSLIKPA